jgi:hypothetical protein
LVRFSGVSVSKSDLLLMGAAFVAYTGMYAVRKSFLAAQFLEFTAINGFHFKTLLIISQVIGYMLSKFIGIKVVAELSPQRRFSTLLGLVGIALISLLAFAYVPFPLKPFMMLLNGLPLGMVFGLVLVYLEGRKNTELLVAGLSATFIFSTGLVKSTGIWLMQNFQVGELLMPFVTGLVYFPVFVLACYTLSKTEPPSVKDRELRTERKPMSGKERTAFLEQHGMAFLILALIYVILTVVRDFRDNFIVEFWQELGKSGQPELLTFTEVPVAVLVLVICSLGILVLQNEKAFLIGMVLTGISGILMLLTTWMFTLGYLEPVLWMILSGFAVYLPYILFHCLIFERFLAVLRFTGTVGFLFYVADAFGYLGSVSIMIIKETWVMGLSWVNFFTELNSIAGVIIVMLAVFSIGLTLRKLKSFKPSLP